MLLALAANAATNITAETAGSLRAAINAANPGDTIILAGGTYVEASSISLNKNVVVMASEGESPVVQLGNSAYFKMQENANSKLIGLILDGATNSTQYGIRPYDNSHSSIIIEDCEFYGFTKNIITCDGTNHADSVIIDNCYFHDNTRAAVYFAASTSTTATDNCCDYVKVSNTTIANVSGLSGAGAIDIRNNGANVSGESTRLFIDHCTFYNIVGYERVVHSLKSPLVSISNCIFSNPDSVANYATWAYGGEVKNCLTNKIGGHRNWDSCPTITDCVHADPLFVNAANGDYTLDEGSPALGAGTDGSNLGDPRWWPAAAPALPAIGIIGMWDNWQYHELTYAEDNLTASVTIPLELNNDYGYGFKVVIDGKGYYIPNPAGEGWYAFHRGWTSEDSINVEAGDADAMWLAIDAAGDYTFTWTLAEDKIDITFPEAPKPTVAIAGAMNGWNPTANIMTPAEDGLTASVTLNLTDYYYQFKVVLGGNQWLSVRGDNNTLYVLHRGWNSVSGLVENDSNFVITPDVVPGDYTFTWEYATGTLSITFPELPEQSINVHAQVNNQEGTLLTSEEQVQGTAVSFGVNANNERVAADAADAVMVVTGTYHSEHGLTGSSFVVTVPGNVDIEIGQCTYSSSAITVKNAENETVASKPAPEVACWKNDTNNVTILHYVGPATTLTISGMTYCPYVHVFTPAEEPIITEDIDVAAQVNNQEGTLLTSEEQVQGTTINFGVNAAGARVAADDANAIMVVAGKYHSEHGLTNSVFTVHVPGMVEILVGLCTYGTTPIYVKNADNETIDSNLTPELACWKNNPQNVAKFYYDGPATTLTISGMKYCPYVRVHSISQLPTDVQTLNAEAKVLKVMLNGRIYIIRDGIRYNALGQAE